MATGVLTNRTSRQIPWINLVWMGLSSIWVLGLLDDALGYAVYPDYREGLYDPSSYTYAGWFFRILAMVLAFSFCGLYIRTLYRAMTRPGPWFASFGGQDAARIRWTSAGLAVALNLLPGRQLTWFNGAFIFVTILWVITSSPDRALLRVIQSMVIPIVTFALTEQAGALAELLLTMVAVGGLISAFVINRGLVSDLIVERSRVRDQAVTEERFRIARDLHDTVGHSMTQITLKAELARRVLATDSARAAAELEQIEHLSRNLAREIRAAVEGEDQLGVTDEIIRSRQLLESMNVASSYSGDDVTADLHRSDVLAWCVREGVMNVVKHSGATRCEINLDRRNDATVLIIRDNGSKRTQSNKGQGLDGMRQRVEAVGGTVRFDQDQAGHVLIVTVPRA